MEVYSWSPVLQEEGDKICFASDSSDIHAVRQNSERQNSEAFSSRTMWKLLFSITS